MGDQIRDRREDQDHVALQSLCSCSRAGAEQRFVCNRSLRARRIWRLWRRLGRPRPLGGHFGGNFGGFGFHRGFGFGGGPYYAYYPYAGCWRWHRVLTPYGWRLNRVNACYYPYY